MHLLSVDKLIREEVFIKYLTRVIAKNSEMYLRDKVTKGDKLDQNCTQTKFHLCDRHK